MIHTVNRAMHVAHESDCFKAAAFLCYSNMNDRQIIYGL